MPDGADPVSAMARFLQQQPPVPRPGQAGHHSMRREQPAGRQQSPGLVVLEAQLDLSMEGRPADWLTEPEWRHRYRRWQERVALKLAAWSMTQHRPSQVQAVEPGQKYRKTPSGRPGSRPAGLFARAWSMMPASSWYPQSPKCHARSPIWNASHPLLFRGLGPTSESNVTSHEHACNLRQPG